MFGFVSCYLLLLAKDIGSCDYQAGSGRRPTPENISDGGLALQNQSINTWLFQSSWIFGMWKMMLKIRFSEEIIGTQRDSLAQVKAMGFYAYC